MADPVAAMDGSPEFSSPMETVTETWRSQSLNAVLWATLLIATPVVLMAVIQWPTHFTTGPRILSVVFYLLTAAIAMCRGARTQWRAWALFLLSYVVIGFQLYHTGMAGSGRIGLMIVPMYALILAGFRSGWVSLVLGALLYAAFIGLLAWGPLAKHAEIQENLAEPGHWIVQGMMLLLGLVPLLVLLTRFRALHVEAVEAKHRAWATARNEIVRRTAACEALEQADREHRRLEEEITQASEQERRRLGSELHDGLCQQLTAALLQCVAIENGQATEPGPTTVSVRTLRGLLEDAIGMTYEIARGLCPLDIGADSLGAALESLVKRTREATGLECEFQEEGSTMIGDGQTSLHLYRIAQESITNAIKHARPQRILVTVRGDPNTLLLQVEDNGCGMPATQGKSRGMGMNIMAYRASVLGGKFYVEQLPGGGTRIVCMVPRRTGGDVGPGHHGGPPQGPGPCSHFPEDAPHDR